MANDFKQTLQGALHRRPIQRVRVDDARDAAVLLPIVAGDEPRLIFTVRTDTLPHHKGQISFPGGSIDATDPSAEFAALRETQEEIGLDPGAVEVLGELDTLPTFVSGFVVSPFVGWLDREPLLEPNPAEVAEVLEVPIVEIAEDIRREPGFVHEERAFPTEAWVWNGHVIWGVTARLLRSFLEVLADAGLAPPPGETISWTGWPIPSQR